MYRHAKVTTTINRIIQEAHVIVTRGAATGMNAYRNEWIPLSSHFFLFSIFIRHQQ